MLEDEMILEELGRLKEMPKTLAIPLSMRIVRLWFLVNVLEARLFIRLESYFWSLSANLWRGIIAVTTDIKFVLFC